MRNNLRAKYGIIGAGPAGYTLAEKLGSAGFSVALFEKEMPGGTCLNKGCIPTKSILHNSNLVHQTKKLNKFGFEVDATNFNFNKIIEHKDSTVAKLNKSLSLLIKSYGVELINEEVVNLEAGRIYTNGSCYECEKIIIATGTKPANIKNLTCDDNFVYNSDGILNLSKLPKSILIVGSGAIGVEWSRIFSDLAVDVTLVEAMPNILPAADIDVSARVERLLKKKRVKIEKSVTVESIENKVVRLSSGKELEPEIVLVAIGREPVLPNNNLGFEKVKGYLKVDNNYQTSIENIYAIGDINAHCMLAHSATHQAIELGRHLLEDKECSDLKIIPSVVYGVPEVAWFGDVEQQLQEKNLEYKKILFPISAIGKAHADEEIDGFVKILADNVGQIHSVSIVAPEASSLLMQFLIAKTNNLPYSAITNAVFPHPTFSEAVYEAVLALDNKSLSLPQTKGEGGV